MSGTGIQMPLEPGWLSTVLRRVRLEAPLREFVNDATDEQLEQVNRLIRKLTAAPPEKEKP